MTIREQLEQLSFAYYAPSKPAWTLEHLHEGYMQRFGATTWATFKQRFNKNRKGLFEKNEDGNWWSSIEPPEPELAPEPPKPDVNQVVTQMLFVGLKHHIDAICTKDMIQECLYDVVAELLPAIVKKEFDERVSPAVNEAVNDRLKALNGLENDVRETIVSTLTQAITDLSGDAYRCVPKEKLEELGFFDDDIG